MDMMNARDIYIYIYIASQKEGRNRGKTNYSREGERSRQPRSSGVSFKGQRAATIWDTSTLSFPLTGY